MNLITFLLENWDSALVVIGIAFAAVIMYKRGEIKYLEGVMFLLVTKAEQEFGSGGTGELKRAAVIDWVYKHLPAVIRIFVSEKDIDRLIEAALKAAKDKWTDNPNLLGAAGRTPGTQEFTVEYSEAEPPKE